jgi:hypothetical protein
VDSAQARLRVTSRSTLRGLLVSLPGVPDSLQYLPGPDPPSNSVLLAIPEQHRAAAALPLALQYDDYDGNPHQPVQEFSLPLPPVP